MRGLDPTSFRADPDIALMATVSSPRLRTTVTVGVCGSGAHAVNIDMSGRDRDN